MSDLQALTEHVYPRRPPYFCLRFQRLLGKVLVAQELGPMVYILLSMIALTEDARKYRRAVTFWDSDLARLMGARTTRVLEIARAKAVKEGWLSYVPGSRRGPGSYFVLIPDDYEGWDDLPTDEGITRSDRVTNSDSESTSCHKELQRPHNSSRVDDVDQACRERAENVDSRLRDGGENVPQTCPERAPSFPVPVPVPAPVPEREGRAADAASPRPPRRKGGAGRFVEPTEAEVASFCSEEGLSSVDQASWLAFYRSNGWKVGRNPMRDWRACLQRWDREERAKNPGGPPRAAASGRRDGFRGDFLLGFGPASPPIPTTAEVAQ